MSHITIDAYPTAQEQRQHHEPLSSSTTAAQLLLILQCDSPVEHQYVQTKDDSHLGHPGWKKFLELVREPEIIGNRDA